MRLILGFSPGSMSDQIARAIAPALSRELGQSIEVVLKPGDSGARAAVEAAHSKPDGDTLFVATMSTHALAPHFVKTLPYEPLRDFAPVSLVSRAPLVLACHPGLAAQNVPELIALARRGPRALAYGTSSFGGAPHLAAALFEHVAEVELRYARYEETEKLYGDLEAGRIALSFNNAMSMLPRCRRGALRALGVTTRERSRGAPEIPAIAESGLHEYDVSNWLGLVAPKRTSPDVTARLSRAVANALRDEGVVAAFREAGVEAQGSTPDAFGEFMARELGRWRPIVERIRKQEES